MTFSSRAAYCTDSQLLPIVISTTVIKQHEGLKYTDMSLKGANFLKKQVRMKLKYVK